MSRIRGLSNSVEMTRVAKIEAPVHVATVQFILTGLFAHICFDGLGEGHICLLDRGLLFRRQALSESLKGSQNVFLVSRFLQNRV